MTDPSRGIKSKISQRLVRLKSNLKLGRSPSPPAQVPSTPGTPQIKAHLGSNAQTTSVRVLPSTFPNNASNESNPALALTAGQANSGPYTSRLPPTTVGSAGSIHSKNIEPPNPYAATGGLSPGAVDPETGIERMGSVVYEGLKTAVQGLYDCSDIFLPLKTATGGLLTIIKIVETVSGNKKELEDLKRKLEAIVSIVKTYQKYGGLRAVDHRINIFCEAIVLQLKAVDELQDHSVITRAALGKKDADTIMKAFRNVSSLCDVFQIDTQLHIEKTVGDIEETVGDIEGAVGDINDTTKDINDTTKDINDTTKDINDTTKNIDSTMKDILQRLNSGTINKLNHKMTSYKTRHSSYGDPSGCLPGTRVKILEDLEAWASDANTEKVYWMMGMAGTGKSTISHTLCEILEGKNMLGGSFFGSRASVMTNNARLIIPVIAYALASASPSIKSEVIKAIEDDPALAEPTYIKLDEQFKRLIYYPVRTTASKMTTIFKVVVIDAVDECTDLNIVASLIKIILQLTADIPLKIFIASRAEDQIHRAFYHFPQLSIAFKLHEVEKHVVKEDIRKYIKTSLSDINMNAGPNPTWPTSSEVSKLTDHSDRLFIYAATAIRYIRDGGRLYKSRLSTMANRDLTTESKLQTSAIDNLYGLITEQACALKEESEVGPMRQLVSMVIFLQNPLSIHAIASLSEIDDALPYLSPLSSVIYIPDPAQPHAVVAPFHASFPNFITDHNRSSKNNSSFPTLVPSEGHGTLALKCLALLNRSLKYNVCDVPEELTVSRRGATNRPDDMAKIPEVLKYSCVYWASHLAEAEKPTREVVDVLWDFLHVHLLHWIECLSIIGKLETGVRSLQGISTVLADLKMTDTRCHRLQSLVDEGRQCLQRNFECIRKHWFEIYWSALVWMPKTAVLREVYVANFRRVPRVVLGLFKTWGQTEITIHYSAAILCVGFSPDGSQVVSGSSDNTVRIWSTTTGEVEAELRGHTDWVRSIAFSQNGNQVVSGSHDNTVRIWSTTTGEVEAELKGHTDWVTSVVFSQDCSRVVSGSNDNTVRIWSTLTGEVEVELKGHTDWVTSVALSQDGSRVVSGSNDNTLRIWSTMTGEVEAELHGHTSSVRSVAFSQDSSQVVSGSSDKTVRVWSTITGEVETELKGHMDTVRSVAFSQDGRQVVSGSDDNTVRIWSTITGKVDAELKGHTSSVRSVAFSQDDSRVVSGSPDRTVRIWRRMTGEVEAAGLKGHTSSVRSVAFSQDGSQVVSGSDDKTVRIWSTMTGEAEAEFKGHMDSVISVAFSQDGRRVVSGSSDKTVRVWSIITGEVEAVLKGHTGWVTSVAFSQDGNQVISFDVFHKFHKWDMQTDSDTLQVHSNPHYSRPLLDLQPTLSLSDDHWLVNGLYDCWIPPHERGFRAASFSRLGVCFGYNSGRVVVLNMTIPP